MGAGLMCGLTVTEQRSHLPFLLYGSMLATVPTQSRSRLKVTVVRDTACQSIQGSRISIEMWLAHTQVQPGDLLEHSKCHLKVL